MSDNLKLRKSSSNGIDFATHLANLDRAVDELNKSPTKSGGFGNEWTQMWNPSELPTPALFPRSGTTDLPSAAPTRGQMSPVTTCSSGSSVTSTETTTRSNVPAPGQESVLDLKWKIMKLTAENLELKSANQQMVNAGAELVTEYQKMVKIAKELRQSLSNAQNKERQLRQEIMELESERLASKSPPAPLRLPQESKSNKSKYTRRSESRRTSLDPAPPKPVQKATNQERERTPTEASELCLDPSDRVQAGSKITGKMTKTLLESSIVYTTPSNESVTPTPSARLSKYATKADSPQASTSRFVPWSKPKFEFQFKNITQSLKKSKNFTNFLLLTEDNPPQVRKTGSDSTNGESDKDGIPFDSFTTTPKSFMNAILGLRNSSFAVLDPEVKEAIAKVRTEDNENSNESQSDKDKDKETKD